MLFYTYMLANKPFGTLYVGHTDDLIKRVYEHKHHLRPGFTKMHDVTQLVWYEMHKTREAAFHRETRLKHWKRDWKIDLINAFNSEWYDQYDKLL